MDVCFDVKTVTGVSWTDKYLAKNFKLFVAKMTGIACM